MYAVQVENQAIKVWHWPRYMIPHDIRRGHPNPASWGVPIADLSQWHGGCNVNETFHTQTIVRTLFTLLNPSPHFSSLGF